MLKYSDASNKSSYFKECLRRAFAMLRFSSLDEINEIDTECKKMVAYIIADLSRLTVESKLFLDRLAKTYQNLYVPLLYKNYENLSGEGSENYIKSATSLISKITALVKEKYVVYEDAQIDVANDLTDLVGRDVTTPEFREAQSAVNLAKSIYSASEQISNNHEKDMNELEAQYLLLHNKYRNTATAKASALRTALSAYSSVEAIIDSCYVAKILRSEYSLVDNNAVVSFLDKDMETLIESAANTMKKYLDQEGI